MSDGSNVEIDKSFGSSGSVDRSSPLPEMRMVCLEYARVHLGLLSRTHSTHTPVTRTESSGGLCSYVKGFPVFQGPPLLPPRRSPSPNNRLFTTPPSHPLSSFSSSRSLLHPRVSIPASTLAARCAGQSKCESDRGQQGSRLAVGANNKQCRHSLTRLLRLGTAPSFFSFAV